MSSTNVQVDVKEIWRICKKHMTEKQREHARKEVSEYINKCVLEAQGFTKQVLGE